MKLRASISFLMLLLFLRISPVMASDWPQFLGPSRNGSSTEKIRTSWDKNEPIALWTKKVGAGFAGAIVVSNTVVLFHRSGSSEILSAFDLATGADKWQSKSRTTYKDDFGFDEGPRATP